MVYKVTRDFAQLSGLTSASRVLPLAVGNTRMFARRVRREPKGGAAMKSDPPKTVYLVEAELSGLCFLII
jgi:hypothetical protein